jgi:hypothetical protein
MDRKYSHSKNRIQREIKKMDTQIQENKDKLYQGTQQSPQESSERTTPASNQ